VRRGDPASALETLRYARGLLRAGATVFLFPEGTLRPAARDLAPLERGVEVLARSAGATCLPVAIRYAFFEAERPDVLLDAGEAHPAAALPELSDRLRAVVERVDAARSLAPFRPLVSTG
jgi:1-acyl-sn-glycerol-3-phosphate acyltransferase